MEFIRKFFEGKEKERNNILLMIFLIGILIITFLPSFTKNDVNISTPTVSNENLYADSYERDLEIRLEKILSNVSGAGDVDVMISTNKSSELVVSQNLEQTNSTTNELDSNQNTRTTEQISTKTSTQVLGQNEEPLIITELKPTISGVIIVSSGANDVHVKDALIRSVSTLLEIPSYKVEVLQKK